MPGAVELQPDSPDPHVAVLLEYLRIAVLLRRPQYLGSRCTRTYGNGYDRENLPERSPMVLKGHFAVRGTDPTVEKSVRPPGIRCDQQHRQAYDHEHRSLHRLSP